VQIFTDKNYLRKILEVINSCGCLLEGEGLLSTIGPVNLSRTTTDSTLLDYPKSQSDLGDSQDEEEGQQGPELPPTDDGDKHKLLLKIRDCLGLLRELFFMSRQSIPLDQRSPPLFLSPRSRDPSHPFFPIPESNCMRGTLSRFVISSLMP
jgi:hypothetical protein